MPRVRVLASVAGSDLVPGELRDLSGEEASILIAQGRAELIRESPTTETTTARTRVRSRQETR